MSLDAAHPGRTTVDLEPGQRLGPVRVPGADLVVSVRSGELTLEVAPPVPGVGATRPSTLHVGTGDAVPLPRGTTFAVRAGDGGATLEVTARPPGPEVFVGLAARRPSPPLAALAAAAVEQGVELLPSGPHTAGEAGSAAR